MRPPRQLTATVLFVITTGLLLAACSSGSSAACSRVVRSEAADDSQLHVIPTANIDYSTDPPTSGPHAPGPLPGVYVRTLSPPEQVGVLERGDVIVQFKPSIVSGSSLASLVDDQVVLMPNSELAEDIVLTAWVHSMECEASEDLSQLATFIAERKDQGPTPHAG